MVVNTHDDDTDPTGMRALLRGLPDPGPMPDDLVDRIHASLADLPPLAGDETLDDHEPGVSRGTSPRSHPSWWGRHGSKAAIAAVVLIGGGALASGPLGLMGSGAGDDAVTSTSADSAGGSAESLSKESDDTDGSQASSGTPEAVRGRATTPGSVVVRHSGRAYTSAALSTQIESRESAPTTSPLAAEAPGIGPIGTEIGVRSCLEAIGLPRDTAADVDLGTLDGTPTAVLLVTLGGERTAYAVGRDCTTDNPSVLAGPVTLP